MSDPFNMLPNSKITAPPTSWASNADTDPSLFVPFPPTSQPVVTGSGYGDGGYGDNPYGVDGIAPVTAPPIVWTIYLTK